MKTLLFTGASGFLGGNTLPILAKYYSIKTMGLTTFDDFKVNLAIQVPNLKDSYDIVFHAAGKAHSVPKTEQDKQAFFDVNYKGTINLCKSLEANPPKSFVFISTVAVYGAVFGENIKEDHLLNGETPYALSKIKAELYLIDWCQKYNVILSIIRPSLIAGPNPPGNLGDMIRGIKTGRYFSIGGGQARKSVVMIHDIANLIPLLVDKGGIYNVCDNRHPNFSELELVISSQLRKKKPLHIPYWLAKCMALVGDCLGKNAPINSLKLRKITESLTFSNEKVKKELGWEPLDVIENFNIV